VDPNSPNAVVVYWRPACDYCSSLRRALRRAGVATQEINIWRDPAAAAFVRSVAGGNVTVPTVVIGPRAFVNPAPRLVVETIREEAPDLLPAERDPSRTRRWRFGWLTRAR
jgi:glutaredoxin